MAAVLVTALAVGARRPAAPSAARRAHHIASEIRCPTCRGLSAADSDAATARAVREEIRRRVEAGETDAEIRAALVARFGTDILLNPEGTGVAALVWVLPVAGLVCALDGITVAFRRWRARPDVTVSAEDRARVERALRS
jgi:cytochrome c-type biogenesis protein CcmH